MSDFQEGDSLIVCKQVSNGVLKGFEWMKRFGPVPLPDGKKFGWINDPGGNMVGLFTKG